MAPVSWKEDALRFSRHSEPPTAHRLRLRAPAREIVLPAQEGENQEVRDAIKHLSSPATRAHELYVSTDDTIVQ